jgi:hypothetical protein
MPEGERGGKIKEVVEGKSVRLKLSWFDLRAGHWPDSKVPSWGLNTFGAIEKKWPAIGTVLKQAGEVMKIGEEKVWWSGEIEFPDGRIEAVDIKIWVRKPGGADMVDLWVWPKAKKYYEKEP